MPTVSVLLPVLNGERDIKQCIDSMLAQTLRDFELIVIDDGSTDGTAAVVSAYCDSRIRLISLAENGGTANALNLAWSQSDSKYIALMDHDDIAVPQRLEWQVRMLNGQPRIAAAGGQMNAFGEAQGKVAVPLLDGQIKANLLAATQNLLNPTTMLRRKAIDKTGIRWDAKMSGVFDWAFWCELMFQQVNYANHPEVLLHYRIHGGQQSKDQRHLRPLHAEMRLKILAAFFPDLPLQQATLVEPLLQWIQPPPLNSEAVKSGLQVLSTMLNQPVSRLGEDRNTLNNFLKSCYSRWDQALRPAHA